MAKRLAGKVLLVVWAAADWKVITPLLDAGKLPSLAEVVDGGVVGDLEAADLSSARTGLASGKRPGRPGPPAAPAGPKAVWGILAERGLRPIVVGWGDGGPGASERGVFVSRRYGECRAPRDAWPLPPGAVVPARLEAPLAGLRVHPAELGPAHILPFVPRAAEVDPASAGRLALVAEALAGAASNHAAATWLVEHERWDFLAVRYFATASLGGAFMRYHPPRLDPIPPEEFERWKDVVTGAYLLQDMMLGRLLALAGPGTTVIVASDHGVLSGADRPALPAGAAPPPARSWKRRRGILCVRGPGVRRDERICGASVLDVAPTVLALFGLPAASDMDGRPLEAAFEEPLALERVASYEGAARPPAPSPLEAALARLRAGETAGARRLLGGVLAGSPALPAACALMGEVARAEGAIEEALGWLGKAEAAEPAHPHLHCWIGDLYRSLRRFPDAERAYRRAIAIDEEHAPAHHALAVTLLWQGRPAEAAEAALRSVVLRHDVSGAHLTLGVALAAIGEPARAREALETCLRLRPGTTAARLWLERLGAPASGRIGT